MFIDTGVPAGRKVSLPSSMNAAPPSRGTILVRSTTPVSRPSFT